MAVVEYTRALQSDPDNVNARTGVQRAKLRASQDHFTRARRLAGTAGSTKRSPNTSSPPS